MIVNVTMKIDWDEESIQLEDIITFLNQCGENCYTDTEVIEIKEVKDE